MKAHQDASEDAADAAVARPRVDSSTGLLDTLDYISYADPHPPFQRKCAFDVGDYGQSLRPTTTSPQRTDTPTPARSGLLRQLPAARL